MNRRTKKRKLPLLISCEVCREIRPLCPWVHPIGWAAECPTHCRRCHFRARKLAEGKVR